MMMVLSLSFLTACLQAGPTGDCRYLDEDCEWFKPAGLNCGLAHQLHEHRGASCAGDYDPALHARESRQEVAVGEADVQRRRDARCPEGYKPVSIIDPDARRNGDALDAIEEPWWTCVSEGNASTSSASLRDVPAGSVCGLSRPASGEINFCEGKNPALGECPDGYQFRWVVERSTIDEDEHCEPQIPSEATNATIRPIVFCEVREKSDTAETVGCVDDCPPDEAVAGNLCGLHVRYGLGGAKPQELAIWDLESPSVDIGNENPEVISALSYLEFCAPHQEYLNEPLMDALDMYADLNLSASCKGQPIGDGGDCPEGYTLQCTTDCMGSSCLEEAIQRLEVNLCWCDQIASCQGEPGWCDTRTW